MEVEPLVGPGGVTIEPKDVDLLRVRYVPVTRTTDATGAIAPWPDPLPPFTDAIDLRPGRNQPVWVRVNVPRDVPPGLYAGAIRLRADKYVASVPLRVYVHGFELPDRMTCTSAFGFSPGNVWRYHRLTDPEDRKR